MIEIGLASPLRWYEEVCRKGLACLSGCFVFAVTEELAAGALVLVAGRQGRGCSLRLAPALAKPKRGGWELSWQGYLEEYRLGRPATRSAATDNYYRLALWSRLSSNLEQVLNLSPGADER